MRHFIKNLVYQLPYPLAKQMVKVPFNIRLGKVYTDFSKLAFDSNDWTDSERLKFVLFNLNKIKHYGQTNFDFYRDLYQKAGVYNLTIKSLEDWNKLPLISKEMLRGKINEFNEGEVINTGGTTGEPFSFVIDQDAWAREWAHMHRIWEFKGYNYKCLKITIRGKNLGTQLFRFNAVHNEFILNSYSDFRKKENGIKLYKLITSKKIHFIHGYPSAIYSLLKSLNESLSDEQLSRVKNSLRIAFLGSEFPAPYMVSYFNDFWNLDYISWYGHSEMCILAYDLNNNNNYRPFLTYGYPEICEGELVGTSYFNLDMPLIRYKTGDLAQGYFKNEILDSFSITAGRSGDFVMDKNGNSISLTALIFGRHHLAFNQFEFIQVKQIKKGEVIIYVTDKHNSVKINKIYEFFDFTNVDIEFQFEKLKSPILSNAGKFKLKIK